METCLRTPASSEMKLVLFTAKQEFIYHSYIYKQSFNENEIRFEPAKQESKIGLFAPTVFVLFNYSEIQIRIQTLVHLTNTDSNLSPF